MSHDAFTSQPASQSYRLIDFEEVDVRPGIVPETYFLTVSGTAPCYNMEVSLSPLVYIRCPEYWGIEVVGHLPTGICLTAEKPYSVTIPLTGITGSEGIEVIGASKREERRVEGGCESRREFTA